MNWSDESIESYAEAKNLIDLVLPSLIDHAAKELKLDHVTQILMFISAAIKVGADNGVDTFALMDSFVNFTDMHLTEEEHKKLSKFQEMVHKAAKKGMQ
jgi:hypothetical protein